MGTSHKKNPSTMHILIVTAAYPNAKAHNGAFLEREVEGMRERGLDITVLHMQGRWKYLRGIFQVMRAALTGKYDIIHGQYSFGGIVALFGGNVPKVITFWGSDVLPDPIEPQNFATKFSHIISPWLARRFEISMMPIQSMVDGLHSPNSRIIPQGIDFAKFHLIEQATARQMLGLNPDLNVRYAMFCANPNNARKGYAVAQKAVELLQRQGHAIDIIPVYNRPHDEVVTFMNATDALILTSSLESGPYVVKEAMACNLPIISTDVGDVAWVIHKTKGCYIAERTPEDVAQKLIISLREVRRTTGRRDMAHLTRENLVDRIVSVYVDVFRNHGRPIPPDMRYRYIDTRTVEEDSSIETVKRASIQT